MKTFVRVARQSTPKQQIRTNKETIYPDNYGEVKNTMIQALENRRDAIAEDLKYS